MWNKVLILVLALVAVANAASLSYAQANIFFQSGVAVSPIGAIMWIPPTLNDSSVTIESWIFGNVSYVGSPANYKTFILDLNNKSITCIEGFTNGSCYKNNTDLKRGWHSIQVYLRNSAGENWSEKRYIFVNISDKGRLNIIFEEEAAGMDNSIYIMIIGFFLAILLMVFFFRKREEGIGQTNYD